MASEIKPITLTEDLACGCLMQDLIRRSLVMPRYTPVGWWECDVFELTGSGYFREYEVKLSLADLRKDSKKRREIRNTGRYEPVPEAEAKFNGQSRWVCEYETKHDLLQSACPAGPVEFYYVTPEGMVTEDWIPLWAGWIELHDRGDGFKRPTHRWTPIKRFTRPRLHSSKADPLIRPHVLSTCYYRFHTAADALRNRTRAPIEWADEPPPVTDNAASSQPSVQSDSPVESKQK